MAKTWDPEAPYTKGTKVRLLEDLPGIPEGAIGNVRQTNGFRWTRYWVRFGDGEMVGQIGHDKLVPVKYYDEYLANLEAEAEKAADDAARADEEAAASANGEGAEDGGGGAAGATVNGVAIPPHLLARSQAARERLSA